VDVVHDPQQPRADAVRLEIECLARADGAEIGFLYEIFRAAGIAREAARDAVQRVELFQRELLELFGRRFQGSAFLRMRVASIATAIAASVKSTPTRQQV
jgi:hypothetical protein